MSSARAEEVERRLLASWDARDLDAFASCLTDDVEWYDLLWRILRLEGEPLSGRLLTP